MPGLTIENLEKRLTELLGKKTPNNPTQDINAALQVAELLESRGFSFQLKDLCPKSMSETLWRAVFSKCGEEFIAEDPQTPIAVCAAAVKALDKS